MAELLIGLTQMTAGSLQVRRGSGNANAAGGPALSLPSSYNALWAGAIGCSLPIMCPQRVIAVADAVPGTLSVCPSLLVSPQTRPLDEQEHFISAEPLPPPVIPGNYDKAAASCSMNVRWSEVVGRAGEKVL